MSLPEDSGSASCTGEARIESVIAFHMGKDTGTVTAEVPTLGLMANVCQARLCLKGHMWDFLHMDVM